MTNDRLWQEYLKHFPGGADAKFAMRLLLLAGVFFSVSECAAPPRMEDRQDFLAEATRTYEGETQERVIGAALNVLRQSDPRNFQFENSFNGFTGYRKYFIYAVIAASQGTDKWIFDTQVSGGGVRALVTASDSGEAVSSNTRTRYSERLASVPLYRLFWSRVDYVLGRRPDWITCDEAQAALDAAKMSAPIGLSGLCGPTSAGRNNPPPDRLPPLSARGRKGAPPAAVRPAPSPPVAAVSSPPESPPDQSLTDRDRTMNRRN